MLQSRFPPLTTHVRNRINQFEIENHCNLASNFKDSKNYFKMNTEAPHERKLKSEMVTQILVKSQGNHFHFIPNGVQKKNGATY